MSRPALRFVRLIAPRLALLAALARPASARAQAQPPVEVPTAPAPAAPSDPTATAAEQRLAPISVSARAPAPRGPLAPESPSNLSRAELISVMGAIGMGLGATACGFYGATLPPGSSCHVEGAFGAVLVGAALATFGATVASWRGILPGQAVAVEAGTFWGAYQGSVLALWVATSPGTSSASTAGIAAGLLGGGAAVGLTTGVLTAALVRPRAGQVALANSGALWGATAATFIWGALRSGDGGLLVASQLIGLNAGLIAGVVASVFYPVSRPRMLLVDLGSLLGGAVFFGIGAAISSAGYYHDLDTFVGVLTPIGIAAGFATTLALTHRLDYPAALSQAAARASLAPVSPSGAPGLSLTVRF